MCIAWLPHSGASLPSTGDYEKGCVTVIPQQLVVPPAELDGRPLRDAQHLACDCSRSLPPASLEWLEGGSPSRL